MPAILERFSLKNKLVVVLGADGRIGQIAMRTVKELDGTAIGLDLPDCDITSLASLYQHNQRIAEMSAGGANAVINCTVGNQTPTWPPNAGFAGDLAIGLTGAANALEAFTIKPGGSHTLIGSDLSFKAPDPQRYPQGSLKPASYSAIKAGLLGLTRYYAVYLAKNHVRVNLFAPAHLESGQLIPDSPIPRTCQPIEIATAIAFLVSDASSYMTGAELRCDGGASIW